MRARSIRRRSRRAASAAAPPRPRRRSRPACRSAAAAMAVKPRPGAAEPAVAATPQQRAAARLEAARTSKIERPAYEIIRDTDRLDAWIARAYDTGVVAINIETIGIDPMQAPLCGIALAVAPNEACYIPLAHRKGGDGDGLFGGGLHPEQISEKAALAALKPLLEERGRPQDRIEPEIRAAGVRGARHRDAVARGHDADVLRARRRPLRPFARRARRRVTSITRRSTTTT